MTATAENPFVEFLRKYRGNPVLMVYEVWGAIPDYEQARILDDVAEGHRRVAAKSGHGVGKTTALAWLSIWFQITRFPCKVVVTAPTSSQLYDAYLAELRMWIKRLPPALESLLEVKAERVELKSSPESAFITARTSRAEQPDALQGVHSENVLLIADEGAGIPDQVFEAASGSMSGSRCYMVMTGNPTRNSGYFNEAFTGPGASLWRRYTISCLTSNHADPEFIREMAETYGEDSNVYRIRVLGEFPRTEDDVVIPWHLVQAAINRDITQLHTVREVWGLDVARFGDDLSALCRRRGRVMREPIKIWRGLDTMQLSGAVKSLWDGTPPSERPTEILVDVIGIGAGVVDRLRELNLPVVGINVSESPALGDTYLNLRAELWWRGREWFATRQVSIIDDGTLIKQLTSVKVEYTSVGKLAAEQKSRYKKRLPRMGSPDYADAFLLTFAGDAATTLFGSSQSGAWNKPVIRGYRGVA